MTSSLLRSQKAAMALYLLASILLLGFGFTYVFRQEFMSYHSVALGMSWSEVPPAFQVLIIALMKAFGGGMLATAITITILVWIPCRAGIRWAFFAIPTIGIVSLIPSLWATLLVAFNTPASPPWQAATVGILLFLVGATLSLPKSHP